MSIRSGSSFLLRLVGFATVLFGLGFAGATLMVESGELQVLFGLFALGGLLVALAGGLLMAIGALLGRKRAAGSVPALTPVEQQRLDAEEFLASRQDGSD